MSDVGADQPASSQPMTAVLNQDLGPALSRTARQGAAHVADVLGGSLRQNLLAEVAGGEYVPLPAVQGPHGVRQDGTHLVMGGTDVATLPWVDALRRAVAPAVRAHAAAVAGLDAWRPDEVSVQRYEPGGAGISVHRDGRRHRYLVAIFTLQGSAPLRLCADREGTTLNTWQAASGSLVLLRGPGLGGVEDGRPLHAVDGPVGGSRTSLTLRSVTPSVG